MVVGLSRQPDPKSMVRFQQRGRSFARPAPRPLRPNTHRTGIFAQLGTRLKRIPFRSVRRASPLVTNVGVGDFSQLRNGTRMMVRTQDSIDAELRTRVRTVQRLESLTLAARQPCTPTQVPLGLPNPLAQGLRRAADLRRHRHDRRPL